MGLLVGALAAACSRAGTATPPLADAADADTQPLLVRVPAALTLARALDTLTVGVDPASLATTEVAVHPGMILGVETDLAVFPQGGARPEVGGRRGYASGTDLQLGADTWSLAHDGLPQPGVRYVAEMQLVLFETDVPPGHAWDPHAGKYAALWTRTLRQAEE